MKKSPWFRGFRIEPWIHQYVTTTDMVCGKSALEQVSREGVKPQAKKVCVHKFLEGPRSDGSVVKEVSDGDTSVRAVFSPAALAEFAQGNGDLTPPDWNKSLIILRKFSLRHQLADDLNKCVFEVVVDEFAFWSQLQGFKPKNIHIYCMQIPDVRLRSNVLWDLHKHSLDSSMTAAHTHTNSEDVSMGSIALSQLLAQMTQPDSQPAEEDPPSGMKVCGGAMEDMSRFISSEPEPDDCLISSSQEDALDQLEEWKPDYKPDEKLSSSPAQSISSSDSVRNPPADPSAEVHRAVVTPGKSRTKVEEMKRTPTRSPSVEGGRVASPQQTSPECIRNNVMAKLDNITALVSKQGKRTTPKKNVSAAKTSLSNANEPHPSSDGPLPARDQLNSGRAALSKPTLENDVSFSDASAGLVIPHCHDSAVDGARRAADAQSPQAHAAMQSSDVEATPCAAEQGLSSEARERLGLAQDVGDYMDSLQLSVEMPASLPSSYLEPRQPARPEVEDSQNMCAVLLDSDDSDCDDSQTLSSVRKHSESEIASLKGSSTSEATLARTIADVDMESGRVAPALDSEMEDAQLVIYTPEPTRSGMCTMSSLVGQDVGRSQSPAVTAMCDSVTDQELPPVAQSTQYDHITDSQLPPPAFPMSPVKCGLPLAQDRQEVVHLATREPCVSAAEAESGAASPTVCEESRLGERLERVRLLVNREEEEEEERLALMRRPARIVEESAEEESAEEESAEEHHSATAKLDQAETGDTTPASQQIHCDNTTAFEADAGACMNEEKRLADMQQPPGDTSPNVRMASGGTSPSSPQPPMCGTQPFTVHSQPELMSDTGSDHSADLFGASVEITPDVIVISNPSSGQSGEDSSQVMSSNNSNVPKSVFISSGESELLSQDLHQDFQDSVVITDFVSAQSHAKVNTENSEVMETASTTLDKAADITKFVTEKSPDRKRSSESKLGSDELISSGEMNSCVPVESSSDSKGSGESSNPVSREMTTGVASESVGIPIIDCHVRENEAVAPACSQSLGSKSSGDSSNPVSDELMTGVASESVGIPIIDCHVRENESVAPACSQSSGSKSSGESLNPVSDEMMTKNASESIDIPIIVRENESVAPARSRSEGELLHDVDAVSANETGPKETGAVHVQEVEAAPSSISQPCPLDTIREPLGPQGVAPSSTTGPLLPVPPSLLERDLDTDSQDTMSICSSESDRRSVRSSSSSTQVMRSTAVRVMKNVKEVSAKGKDRKRRDTMSMISDVVGREHQVSRRNSEVLFNLKKKTPAKSGADVLGKPSQRRKRRALYQESVLLPLGESVLEETSTKSSKFHLHIGRSPSGSSLGQSPGSGSGQPSRAETPSPCTSPASTSRGHTPPTRTSPAAAAGKTGSPSAAGGQAPHTLVQASKQAVVSNATLQAARTPGHTTPCRTPPTVVLHRADTPLLCLAQTNIPSVMPINRTPSQPSGTPLQTSTPASVQKDSCIQLELNASNVVAGTSQNGPNDEEQTKVPKSKTNLLFKYPSLDTRTPLVAQDSGLCSAPITDSVVRGAGSSPPPQTSPIPKPGGGSVAKDNSVDSSDSRLSVIVDQSSSELAEPLVSPPYSAAAAATSPLSRQGSEPMDATATSRRSSHCSEQHAASSTSPRSSHGSEPALSSSHSQPSQEVATDSEVDNQRNVIIDTIKRLNSMSPYSRVPSTYSQTMRRKGSMDSVDSLVLVPKSKTPKAKGKMPQLPEKSPQGKVLSGNRSSPKIRRDRAAKRNRKIIVENSDSESELNSSPVKSSQETVNKRHKKAILVDSDISDSDTSHLQVKIVKGVKKATGSKTKGSGSPTSPRKRTRPVSPSTISLSDEEEEEEEEEEDADFAGLHGNMEKLELCVLQHSERLNRQQRALKEMPCPKFYKDVFNFYKNTDFS